jgi:hypothetical protein
MGLSDTNVDVLLQAFGKEGIKTKSFYDGSNRLTSRYEAFANADNGSPCLKTEYTYNGTTTTVDKSKESVAVWDSSWDL